MFTIFGHDRSARFFRIESLVWLLAFLVVLFQSCPESVLERLVRSSMRPVLAFGLIISIAIAGCSMAPQLENPVEPLPAQFNAAAEAERGAQHYWWHGFGDPNLNRLIDSVIVRNLDLRVAVARVAELQSRYRIARAGQFPSDELAARREQLNTPSNTGIGGQLRERLSVPGGPEFPDRFDYTTYSASLGFAYELDFWGRVRGSKRAALQELLATQSDVRTVLLGIIGETIATYFQIAAHQRMLAVMRENEDILEERAEIMSSRYVRGLVSATELYAAQQDLENARAELPVLESQLEMALGRLSVLLGQYQVQAGTVVVPESAHTYMQEDIPAGLPSDLLQERPDVAAAFQRLEAARERIGVARAARFPSFALTGAAGTQSSTLSEIAQVGQKFWQLGAGLAAPIFNAGAIRANIRAAWAQYEQMASQYEKTVLSAFRDVEATLVTYANLKKQHAFLDAARDAALENAKSQESRYARGIGSYLGVLGARRSLLRSETALVSSRQALAEARLAVHRSLGGAWIDPAVASGSGAP